MQDYIYSTVKFQSVDTLQKVIDSLGDYLNKFSLTYYYHVTLVDDDGNDDYMSGKIKCGKVQYSERREEFYCLRGDIDWINISVKNPLFIIYRLGDVLKIRAFNNTDAVYRTVANSWHDITLKDNPEVIDNLWEKIKEII